MRLCWEYSTDCLTKTSTSVAGQSDAKRPRLLLADDNAAMLEYESRILTAHFDVLAAVPDGESALRETQQLRPDVVVLDISMKGLNGIEVAARLRDQGSKCKIVFLTVHQDSEFVRAALAAGGSAYVLKHCVGSDLVPAIRAAMVGKLFLSDPLQDHEASRNSESSV